MLSDYSPDITNRGGANIKQTSAQFRIQKAAKIHKDKSPGIRNTESSEINEEYSYKKQDTILSLMSSPTKRYEGDYSPSPFKNSEGKFLIKSHKDVVLTEVKRANDIRKQE